MLDEIQCGLGRLGNWCGWKEIVDEEFVPDTISWAKGIGGGFPLGATWIRKKPVQQFDGQRQLTSATCCNRGLMERPSEVRLLPARLLWQFWRRSSRKGCSQNAQHQGEYARDALSRLSRELKKFVVWD